VERQKYLLGRMEFLAQKRNTLRLVGVVAEWQRLTKLHLPRKLRILQFVDNIIKEKTKKLMQDVIHGWWKVSVGPESGR
jgi:hypothetical protein